MNFSDAISIVIASPFTLAMTNGMAYALLMIVAVEFIIKKRGFRLGEVFHKQR